MTVDFNSMKVYAKLQGNLGEWTDISEDVCHKHPISYFYGIKGGNINDRVASSGEMTICFDNSENNSAGLVGYYSPGHPSCRSGFAAGLQIKLVAVYENDTKTLFYGRIPPNGIKPQPLRYGERKTLVTVLDWMEQAAIHEIDLPEYTTNKTAAEVGTLIVANMPIAPLSTELSDCEFTFPYVFDTLKGGHTKAMSELQKACVSEQGRAYVKHGKDYDEIFVIEGKNTRSNTTPTSAVVKPANLCGFLQLETGDYILQEDGTSKIIIDETISLDLEDEMKGAAITHGEEIVTTAKSVCYPRKIDAAANTTLFSLEKVIAIAAGETINGLRGRFRDPDGAATYVTGLNVVATVGTTHYLMNAASAGDGADLTANLALTVEIGADSINYGTITNSGTVDGYITKLSAIGKGVYTYDPVTYVAEDETAKTTYGSYVVSLDMKYQDDPTFAAALTNIIVARKSDPQTQINTVTFIANRSYALMGAFMLCDIGTRVRLTETVSGVDEDYFINGLGAKIYNMRVAEYTWYVSRAADDIYQFWELETAGRSELGVTTYLGY